MTRRSRVWIGSAGMSRAIGPADVDLPRQDGLSDQQITDVALAAAARNFISRYFDALVAGPDVELQEREVELWEYLKNRAEK